MKKKPKTLANSFFMLTFAAANFERRTVRGIAQLV